MSAIRSLKTLQLDALRDTANIGAGHAATALAQMTGRTMLVFPKPTVMRLAERILRRPMGACTAFRELATSAIKEAGNILSGAYMNAIGESAPDADAILCVESELQLMELQQTLRGFFLVLPDPASLQLMPRARRLA